MSSRSGPSVLSRSARVARPGSCRRCPPAIRRGQSIVKAAAIGHDQGIRLLVEAFDRLGQAQSVGSFPPRPVESDDVGPGQSATTQACWIGQGDDDSVLPSFHSPMIGTSTAERVAWISPRP